MTRCFLLAFFSLITCQLWSAQDALTAPKTSSIAGTVMQEPGSHPLKKVLLQVVPEDQKQGGNYTATTDADGHFRIENVSPARYRIFLERTGFAGINERGLKSETNVFTVQPGQSLDGLVFRMLPTAVISGRVTDEDGDPMPQVRVLAQKKRPGKATPESLGMVATNDLGEYRIAGLFPGRYWVIAMPPPDLRDYERPQDKPPTGADQNTGRSDGEPESRYLNTYYPGTDDALQASQLNLDAGDEIPANFTLVPRRTYHVRGIVTGLAPGQKPVVELVSKRGDSIRASEIQPDGQFELRGVGPGSYVLGASISNESQSSLTARQEVTVVAADVDGLKLSPIPSLRLSGHLRVEGGAVADLSQYSANLRQAELPDDLGFFMSQDFFGTNAPVDRSGNFEWKNVNPGNYIVQVYGGDAQGFFLKSVTLGGRDIASGFTASGPATLDLVVSGRSGMVEGVVVEKEKDVDNDHPVANAVVVAVPEEKYRKLPDRFGVGSSDQQGHFTVRGLTPGSYVLYAWQELEDGIWRDADFLKSQQANGTAVKVEEGSDQKIEVKLSPVTEEWR
jgi:hypothetical protein